MTKQLPQIISVLMILSLSACFDFNSVVDNTDDTAPILVLVGENNVTSEQYKKYEDLGAVAVDDIDGVVDVSVTHNIDINTVGTYAVLYKAMDLAGNQSTLTRSVNVIDKISPVISLNGESQLEIQVGQPYIEMGVTIIDAQDGNIANVTMTGEVDHNTLGHYSLTYQGSDSSNNKSETLTRVVSVIDTTSPVLTLNGPQHTIVFQDDDYLELSVTVIDNYDSNLIPTITGIVRSDLIGEYFVNYHVVDSSGNISSISRTIEVIEDLPPQIQLVGPSTVYIYQGDEFIDPGVIATDDNDVNLKIEIDRSGDAQSSSEYQLFYYAIDSKDQIAEVTRTIKVLPSAFITTWDTNNYGISDNNQIKLEANLTDFPNGYNFNIDWGDESYDTNVTGDITHTYAQGGIYEVSITGDYPQIIFNSFNRHRTDSNKLLSVENWGRQPWLSMKEAFYGCSNLTINALDAPNISNVKDMSYAFFFADDMNSSINHWDVSSVTNMSYMFANTNDYNQPLNDWDVSSVEDMRGMFQNSVKFDYPLDNWNMSSVTDTSQMFGSAEVFNQSINNWDVSSVTNMSEMFKQTYMFNQPLNAWDVSSVTDMSFMFYNTLVFDSEIDNWDVSSVIDMNHLFSKAYSFNKSLSNWNVSSVENMNGMFSGTTKFNQPINNWNVSSVENMSGMFLSAENFNQPINNWNVSSVENMSGMFLSATNFNQPINNWNMSSVENIYGMFSGATSFNQPLNRWNVSSVNNMKATFSGAEYFNQDISNWDTSSVNQMQFMFNGAVNFNQDISLWNTSMVTDMTAMFFQAVSFDQDLSALDISAVNFMYGMFEYTKLSNKNYSNLLISWSTQMPTENVDFHGGNSEYEENSAADLARSILIDTYGWNITDGGFVEIAQ